MSSYSTQRLINDPNRVVEDVLQGFFKAHRGLVVPIPENPRVVKYARAPLQGKVGVVTGEVLMWKVGGAKVGDKTIMDALIPAQEAYQAAVEKGASLPEASSRMAEAAEKGKESTRDLVAKIGRSARLGERSRGVLDAGATSGALILQTFAKTLSA